MERIVIVVAMDKELATFKSYLNDLKQVSLRNRDIYLGKLYVVPHIFVIIINSVRLWK